MSDAAAPHDKFTDRFRMVLWLAREEAARLESDYVGTEHLLLGLIKQEEGLAATVLKDLGVAFDRVRQAIESGAIPTGRVPEAGRAGFTPDAMRVLEFAVEEARLSGLQFVGSEHLLLGLIREAKGLGPEVLTGMGVDADRVRIGLRKYLGGAPGGPRP